jgi:energy-coupling factor transporter ATP-binding protein EcfA2
MIEHFANALKPPSDLHPADWCADHVHVENSERGSKFDPSQTRWWRKPMGCYADYETTNMVCIMPTGAGKSTFFEAINCWIPSEAPGSVLYASITDPNAELWGETRFLKAAKKCAPLDHLWPKNQRNAVRKDAIIWPHMFMVLGGANMSNFQEVSITYGQGDEAWAWKPGMVREWNARSHNRENRKFVLASQAGTIATEDGTGDTSELHTEHDKCRKWDFAWQCECGHAQAFKFEQLKYPDKGTDQERADAVVRVCEECGKEHEDTHENRRKLHDSYQENDGYLCANPDGQRGYEGFHLDAGGIWWIPWAEDVLQKIAADKSAAIGDFTQLRQWTQKRRALGFSEASVESKVELKPSGYTRGDYSEGQKIDGEVVRFCTIDAGGSGHFWLRIRAWRQGGYSMGLYFGYINTVEECEQKRIEYGVEARHTFLDVGWEQEQQAGHIVRFGWQGVKGDGKRNSGWPWEIKNGPDKGKSEIRLYSKRWYALSKEKQRATCWHIASNPLQYILQRLMTGDGAEWLTEDDAPPTLAKHLNGERLETTKNSQGQEVKKWVRKGDNHGRDTEAYQVAAALMFKVFTPPVEVLEKSEE